MALLGITTETELINAALLACEAQQIVDVEDANDDSQERELAATTYPGLRDEVLAAHAWNCAVRWVALASDPTDTAVLVAQVRRFQYAYALPSDCVRVLRTNLEEDGRKDEWRIESFATAKRLVYRDSTCVVEYIRRLPSPALMDPALVQAMITRLKSAWIMPLQGNRSAASDALDEYKAMISEAAGVDSSEGTPDDPSEDEHDIIRARD